jgi:dihydroneopterin aldolase
LEEETVIGGNYVVDVVVDLENPKLCGNDDLNETIDYCDVTDVVKDVMKSPKKLIETVCEIICDRILALSKNIQKAEVSLTKIKPPIDGDVEKVKVVITKER